MRKSLVNEISIPADSYISDLYKSTDLSDAFMVQLRQDTITSPEALAKYVFSKQAWWVSALMQVREIFAITFRLRTSTRNLQKLSQSEGAARLHYFKIHSSNDREIILGEDDHHLNFRLSVLYRKPEETIDNVPQLVFSSVVHCHNLLGRFYLLVIAPFHRRVVRSGLRRAHKAGWPK